MYLGTDGEPVLTHEGYAGERSEYDRLDREELKLFLGTDGETLCLPAGYAGERTILDDENRISLHQYIDASMCPVNGPEDFAQTLYLYADLGECRTFLDVKGHPVNCRQGFAYQDIKNNEQGKPMEITYRNAAGEPVSLEDGTFRKAYRYDESGEKLIRTEYYDREEKLLRTEKN